ncbi:Flavohemoprotein [Trichinella pseudospiralis]
MSISANYGLTAHKLDFVFANVPEVQYVWAESNQRFTLRRGTEMTVAAICSDDVIIALNNIANFPFIEYLQTKKTFSNNHCLQINQ